MFAMRSRNVLPMLSDRPYMRGDYPREKTSALTWLICSVIAGFVLQLAAGASWLGGAAAIDEQFALSVSGLRAGRVWTLLTHGFLHDPRYFFHALVSVVMLFLLGRELVPVLGTRRFLGLFAGATAAGGLGWTAVHWRMGGLQTHVGAIAAVDAMLIVFACFFPNRPIDFLLFFVPVSVRPKYLAWAVLGLALFGLFFFELRDIPQPFGRFVIASSAHLGGMAAGWIYFRFVHGAPWRRAAGRAEFEPARLPARRNVENSAEVVPAAPVESREDLRARIDRILDKINSHGIGSVTPAERRLLDEAKDLLSRR